MRSKRIAIVVVTAAMLAGVGAVVAFGATGTGSSG
jgi:hypothetical protein